jgi:hypothetical protein
MKRLTVLLLFAFLSGAALFAQAIQYELKIKPSRNAAEYEAEITVVIKAGQAPCTCYLMTNDPRHGKVLMESGPVRGKTYTFKGVKPGKYFVKIEDSQGLPAGRTVEIKDDNGKI